MSGRGTRFILCLMLCWLSSLPACSLPTRNVVLGDFSRQSLPYRLDSGAEFPGAKASLAWTEVGHSSTGALAISYDFSGGGMYCQWVYSGWSPDAVDAIKFYAKGDSGSGVLVRLVDATGQIHQQSVSLSSSEWELVRIPIGGTVVEHWGGANDGAVHLPLSEIRIGIQVGSRKKGVLLLDNLSAQTQYTEAQIALSKVEYFNRNARVEIASSSKWNVYMPADRKQMTLRPSIPVPDNVAAIQVSLECHDIGGRKSAFPASAVLRKLNGYHCTLSFPNLPAGYYKLSCSASFRTGARVRKLPDGQGTFAVVDSKPRDDGPSFGDAFGLGVHFDQGENPQHLALLSELGVRWVRDSLPWREPQPGKYILFDEALRERLAFYKAQGIGVQFVLGLSGNREAYPNDPFNAEAFGKFAAAAARGLKKLGVRFVFGVWNEPHNFDLRPTLGGAWNGVPPSPWLQQYVKMVHAVVKYVREVDPAIVVLTDEDVIANHYWFLEQGLPRDLAGFGLHPYTHGPCPPERTPYGPEIGWAQPFTVVDSDQSFRSMIRRLRQQAEKKMGTSPQIWATEWGYPVGKWMRPGEVTEMMSAQYLVRTYINSVASGVKTVSWHVLQDMGDGPFGLITNDEKPRKSFYAYRTMNRMLGRCRMVKQLLGADHPANGEQAYLFRGPSGPRLAAWTIDGTAKAVVACRGTVTAVDMLGSRSKSQTNNGQIRVTLTGSPIYLCGDVRGIQVLPRPALSVKSKTKHSQPSGYRLIENFATSVDELDVVSGTDSPGGKTRFSWVVSGYGSAGALSIDYDFSQGGKFALWSWKGEVAGVESVSFAAKSDTQTGITIRTVDATGQTHEYLREIFSEDWQQFSIPLTPTTHWGGADDGTIHQPIREIQIGPNNKTAAVGVLMIDDVGVR